MHKYSSLGKFQGNKIYKTRSHFQRNLSDLYKILILYDIFPPTEEVAYHSIPFWMVQHLLTLLFILTEVFISQA